MIRRPALALCLTLAGALAPRVAAAIPPEPWSDVDPLTKPQRHAFGSFGARLGAEYRANGLYIRPLSLGTETARNASWIEHRLRADLSLDYVDKIKIVLSADMLDGVIWGDNGTTGGGAGLGTVNPNTGANVNARNPNFAVPCVGYRWGDPLDPNAYAYTLCPGNPLFVRKAYGEVTFPFGVLRVGRQPVNDGTSLFAADGDGRPNRFGFSRAGSIVDRVLFATKPLEALKPQGKRDTSPDRGLVAALVYDRWVTDSPQALSDDVQQFGGTIRVGAPKVGPLRDAFASVYYVQRFDMRWSNVSAFGVRGMGRWKDFYAGVDLAMSAGKTREISEALKAITNDPVEDQTILQGGMRAVVRYDRPKFSLYMEADYASGTSDPRSRATLANMVWAEDSNVGLLLFKHVLAFQSARAAAAGTELLKRLGATDFPTQALDTRGAFTNAFALFPQVDYKPLPGLMFRGGALVAWTAAPLIDSIASVQKRSSADWRDDLVNYAGGKPGSFYGVELDARVQYRFLEHFIADLEGAILFPGDALANKDGYAARSTMVQARTTFFF